MNLYTVRQGTTEAKETADLYAQSPRGVMSLLRLKERKHWQAAQREDCLEKAEGKSESEVEKKDIWKDK